MEDQSRWSGVRIVKPQPELKAAPKPFKLGTDWSEVEVVDDLDQKGVGPSIGRIRRAASRMGRKPFDGDGDGNADLDLDGEDDDPVAQVAEAATSAARTASKWSDDDERKLVDNMVDVTFDEGTLDDFNEMVGLRLRRPIKPLTDEQLRLGERIETSDVYKMREDNRVNRVRNKPVEFADDWIFEVQDVEERFAVPSPIFRSGDKNRLRNSVNGNEYVWDGKNWVLDTVMGVRVTDAGHEPRVLTAKEAETLWLPPDGPGKGKNSISGMVESVTNAASGRNAAAKKKAAARKASVARRKATDEARAVQKTEADPEDVKKYADMTVTPRSNSLRREGVLTKFSPVEIFRALRFKRLYSQMSDRELSRESRRVVDDIEDISRVNPRHDDATYERLKQVAGEAIAESPLQKQAVEKYGLPAVVMMQKDPGTYGLHMAGSNTVFLNDHETNLPREEIAYPPVVSMTTPENWSVGSSTGGQDTYRHEYGHWMLAKIMATGTDDQRAAALELRSWYDKHVKSAIKVLRQALHDYRDPQKRAQMDPETIRILEREMRKQDIQDGLKQTEWLTPYGHTNPDEMVAELWAMLTHPDSRFRELVPEDVAKLMERLVDMKLTAG